jgi:hypothetical protein
MRSETGYLTVERPPLGAAAQPWQNAFNRLGIGISCSDERQAGGSNEGRRCLTDDGCDDLCTAALVNCSRCSNLVAIKLLSAN